MEEEGERAFQTSCVADPRASLKALLSSHLVNQASTGQPREDRNPAPGLAL